MSEGFPIDEENRLALDRVKSISVISALMDTEGFMAEAMLPKKFDWRVAC